MYVREDIEIRIIMWSRLPDSKTIKFRTDLGLNQISLILKKEQSVLESIRDAFKGEDMQTQYTVVGYRIDLYFHEHKLAIAVDELGHNNRNIDYEIQRQSAIEKELGCVFIGTNPDAEDFDINRLKNQIYKHIIKSKEEKLKSKFAKELLSYASSIFIPLKLIKYFVKKNTFHIVNMKNTQSKIKPIKIKKRPGTTYCYNVAYKIIPKILGQKK